MFYFIAFLWKLIILSLLPPTFKAYPLAILLHHHCAKCTPPTDPPLVWHAPYNISDGYIVFRPKHNPVIMHIMYFQIDVGSVDIGLIVITTTVGSRFLSRMQQQPLFVTSHIICSYKSVSLRVLTSLKQICRSSVEMRIITMTTPFDASYAGCCRSHPLPPT